MAPQIALDDNTKRVREKKLINSVFESVMRNERFEKSGDVEEYFLQKYECSNVRKFALNIKI